MNNISQVLKEIRTAKNLTQKEFSEKLGIKQSAYSMIELGKNNPSVEVLSAVINEFNINANILFKNNAFNDEVNDYNNSEVNNDRHANPQNSLIAEKGGELDVLLNRMANFSMIDNLVNGAVLPAIIRLLKIEELILKHSNALPDSQPILEIKAIFETIKQLTGNYLKQDNKLLFGDKEVEAIEQMTATLNSSFYRLFDTLFNNMQPNDALSNINSLEDLGRYWNKNNKVD